jgi:hypothetical protein
VWGERDFDGLRDGALVGRSEDGDAVDDDGTHSACASRRLAPDAGTGAAPASSSSSPSSLSEASSTTTSSSSDNCIHNRGAATMAEGLGEGPVLAAGAGAECRFYHLVKSCIKASDYAKCGPINRLFFFPSRP